MRALCKGEILYKARWNRLMQATIRYALLPIEIRVMD